MMNWYLVILVSSVLLVHSANGQSTQRNTTKKPDLQILNFNSTKVLNSTVTPGIGVYNTTLRYTTLQPINSSNINVNVTGDKVRIVGGVETAEHEFPFIVSLSKQGSHFCGATIIHTEWVLTAAHCMMGLDLQFQVKAGEHNIANQEGTEQIVVPTDVFINSKYNASTFENDIALVRINPPFQFNGNVKAFLLPNRKFLASGYATAAGWGTTAEGSHLTSPVLRKVSIPIVENTECSNQYGNIFQRMVMLCAGESEGNKDSCQGDSGGPLMCTHLVERPGVSNLQNETVLCGIVSYGEGCARKGYAGVYTRVSSFIDWIEEQLYGKDVVQNSKKENTSPTSPPIKVGKKPIRNKKSSVNHIHVSTNSAFLLHIFTVCFMYILTQSVIVKL